MQFYPGVDKKRWRPKVPCCPKGSESPTRQDYRNAAQGRPMERDCRRGRSVSACSMVFWTYLKNSPTQDAALQRRAMNERLRQISWHLWKKFDDQPLRAVDALLTVENGIAKLNGLDMPTKTTAAGSNRDAVPLSLDLFAELRQRYEISMSSHSLRSETIAPPVNE
jgi:hypothetical protein